MKWTKIAGSNDQFDRITRFLSALADCEIEEPARKARRMMLLFSFSGIIWCQDITVHKTSLGGIEVSGLVALIPLILVILIGYFIIQCIGYSFISRRRSTFLVMSVNRQIEQIKQSEDDPSTLKINATLKEYKKIKRMIVHYYLWNFYLPIGLSAFVIIGLIDHTYFGWFVGTPAVPLIPHIPPWVNS